MQESIQSTRQKLDDLLRERKVEKLLNYIDLLNREEENIKNTFQNISEEHINQYPDVKRAGYYDQQLLKGLQFLCLFQYFFSTIYFLTICAVKAQMCMSGGEI